MKVETLGLDKFRLLEDVVVEHSIYTITIKKGFVFDGASIPKAFWSLIGCPFVGKYRIPALVHDVLYATKWFDRSKCDAICFDLMKEYGVNTYKRYAMCSAVRAFGGIYWDKISTTEAMNNLKYLKVEMVK